MKPSNKWMRELAWLGAAEAGTAVATAIVLQVWRARLRVPFYNSFDVTLQAGHFKNVLVRGWYFDNPKLGFPTGQNLRDFPLGDGWHLVFLKMFSFVSDDWALALNVFYLGSFALIAATSFVALRYLPVRPIVAAGGAVVTALLPYHLARNEMHVFLSEYSAIPLVVALAVAQLSDRPWLRVRGTRSARLPLLGALAVAVWAGGTGTYYAVMSAVLLALTGIIASVVRRRAEPGLSALVLAAVIAVVLGVQLLPTFVYAARDGRNHAFDRPFSDQEKHALRPALLIAPIPQHRVHALGALAREYADEPYPSTPEPGQTLGLVGAAGFVGLLAMAVTPLVGGRGLRDPNDRALALVGVTSLVLGAGGGAVLAIAGLTEIRAWNRISIFIAFVGVAAAARAFDRLLDRRTRSAPVVLAIVVLTTTVAVLDQSSGADTPHYDTVNAEFSTERDFVREIERAVGPIAAVLQLPNTRYPEEGPQASMDDYSHMKGWLHSDTLRWSYGVVRGRPSWQDGQRGLSIPDQLRRARVAGFTAVWVDRFAFVDAGALVQHVLQDCLGNPIVIERGGRRVLYDLRTDPTC